MSSHARLAGHSPSSFFDQFFSLDDYDSVNRLVGSHCLQPINRTIVLGINNHPNMVRLGAPLLAGSFGLVTVAVGVAGLAEHVFKGLANLFCAMGRFKMDHMNLAAFNILIGVVGSFYFFLKGVVVATVGTVGLIVDPAWTYENVIGFHKIEARA